MVHLEIAGDGPVDVVGAARVAGGKFCSAARHTEDVGMARG